MLSAFQPCVGPDIGSVGANSLRSFFIRLCGPRPERPDSHQRIVMNHGELQMCQSLDSANQQAVSAPKWMCSKCEVCDAEIMYRTTMQLVANAGVKLGTV